MADERFRAADFRYKGRRVAFSTGGRLRVLTGGTPQIASGGHMGVSDGPITSEATVNTIEPVAGIGVAILMDMLRRKKIECQFSMIDGRILGAAMNCLSSEFNWDHTNGTLTGGYEFVGGEPEPVG